MEDKCIILKRYSITFLIMWILTVILAFLSLNRLWGYFNNKPALFDFIFRNFFEHLLTGFYIPLLIFFGWYLTFEIYCICRYKEIRKITSKSAYELFLVGFLIYAISETWWQFFQYNGGSIIQLLASYLGIALSLIYIIKTRLFH